MNTTYFINQIMGNVFHTQSSPAIADKYYLGLSTTSPTVDGVCDGEPSTDGTGYERILLDSLSVPENGLIKNTAAINFNESLTNWGSISYYAVFDSKTGGNLLFFGDLDISKTVEVGTTITVKAGELIIQLYSAGA
ncbi:MAG: hypothetical protein IIW48_08890 [Clostridia bacterium]|nr:hypothetical protein [Clostridia bacterium]